MAGFGGVVVGMVECGGDGRGGGRVSWYVVVAEVVECGGGDGGGGGRV